MDCKYAVYPDHSRSLKIVAINIFLVTEYSDIYLMEFSEVPNWLLPIDIKGKQVLLDGALPICQKFLLLIENSSGYIL